MTGGAKAGPAALVGRFLTEISARGLFFAIVALALLVLAGLSVAVLGAADRAEARLTATIEDRLLSRLEEDGLSGLAAALTQLDRALVPGRDRIEVAVWRVIGQERTLMSETSPGVGRAFRGSGDVARLGQQSFRVHAVDVRAASADWVLPMGDVALVFGIARPSREVIEARTTVASFSAAFGLALVLALGLEFAHWRRYRRGIGDINALLERYSAGETGVRIEGRLPAPELRLLRRQLNTVLPRLDALFADLRAISAHLAHELKNPLQSIRSDVRRIEAEADPAARATIATGVDDTIDAASARLDVVMQLFRLQADAEVAMADAVALDETVEDLCEDHAPALTRGGRDLKLDIAPGVRVRANRRLLELLIDNLLTNAAKYAAGAGPVTVRLTAADGRFRLEIENPGTLAPALAQRAFGRFAQGSGERGGAGLGLALVRAIADRHGFEVGLEPVGKTRVRARLTGTAHGGR